VDKPKDNSKNLPGLTRRKFLRAVGLGGTAPTPDVVAPEAETSGAALVGPGAVPIRLRVNGVEHTLDVEPRLTLLDALRDQLRLTGTKRACDHGECGACTVLANGRPIYACTMLAVSAQGMEITTVEALSSGDRLDPLQAAFIKHDALQCGLCTPGFLMALKALLLRNPHPGESEVRLAMAGNLCQCGM
jgi:aerobic-type carbon monoxide dehydrogenase small subunit (CoxS/CutS family)